MRLDQPFRGSQAIAAGLVTAKTLRGPRMHRLFPDTYIAAEVPDSPELRARAALVCRPGGVLRGRTAGALWAADGVLGYPERIELVVTGTGGRSVPGLHVRREHVADQDVLEIDGAFGPLRITTPARTIVDIARDPGLSLTEAVVAADAIASAHDVWPEAMRAVAERHPGVRGCARIPDVLALMNRRSTSPRRTRVRLALREAGLPRPEVAPWLTDTAGETVGAADLAWRGDLCALQVDRPRAEAERRCGGLAQLGWRLQHVPDDVDLATIVARTRAMLTRAREVRASALRRRRPSVR
jgi:hypothetical protein